MSVSADDVVGIINCVNAHGSGLLPADAKNQKPYVDGDSDGVTTLREAINRSNASFDSTGLHFGGDRSKVAGSPIMIRLG